MSSFVTSWPRCLLAGLVAGCLAIHPLSAQTAGTSDPPAVLLPSTPDKPATALDTQGLRQELLRLDGVCAKLDLVDERELMAGWVVSDSSDARLLYLPVDADPLQARKSSATTTAHANWLKYFTIARSRHAQYWFETAKQQAESGDEWAAYCALWRAAREDSTHAETKRALGPLLTALNVKGKPRLVPTAHPKFPWPAGSYSRMETTNFKITSRADAATTQKIAVHLETYYALWTQTFYPLWAAPRVTAERVAGRNTSWHRRQQMNVILCKDREDYLKTLGVAESNIGVSVGYYNPESQLSFFYPDASLDATLYHELTHQLLAEASQLKGGAEAGDKSHFWLIEAIALYMESLAPGQHHWRLGGWLAPRMQGSRYRALHDGFWLEPRQLDQLGLTSWKERQDIARLYTHVSGLAHFFLDRRLPRASDETRVAVATNAPFERDTAAESAEQRLDNFDAEASRVAFFAALIAVYRGDKPPEKLWELAGQENAQSDYVHFQLVRDRHLHSLDQSPARIDAVTELVMSRSQLNAASWQTVGNFKHLNWLELSNTNATPHDLRWLKEMTNLERLSLEGVEIDRELLATVSQLPKLKELDLSMCQVDDELVSAIKACGQLETLWLSGTQVTSASLEWIEKLPKLRFVSLDQTTISSKSASELNERLKSRRAVGAR